MVDALTVKALARECEFELAGIARALPVSDAESYHRWVAQGFAGEMNYLTDRRAGVRDDPRHLLPSARSILCVGKLYNGPQPYSTKYRESELAWISRYAWGEDYHGILRRGLQQVADRLLETEPFEYKICVDTAPLLERAYARLAGLGWIGRNTCLINQPMGSWFFLGELLTSLDLEPDSPPSDRCGTCTRCVDACPTGALLPDGDSYTLDSRLCISYFTIESRQAVPNARRQEIGNHVFGCDICQDVCPWNGRSPVSSEPGFAAGHFAPPLEELAELTEEEFREMFRSSPIRRSRYSGFLRNVAIAMGNARAENFRRPLENLAASADPIVAEHALWALGQLN
ncbi:MAG TPA: tRNA epoxyqueuosine(34) reductase QueG [Bryobacteraceae bacterium]|jgi:epoxyqueuosine reductase|nr:tRNA epoxyqueuosine(34) reductase QueG [Bryobacteraceae bacterium]